VTIIHFSLHLRHHLLLVRAAAAVQAVAAAKNQGKGDTKLENLQIIT